MTDQGLVVLLVDRDRAIEAHHHPGEGRTAAVGALPPTAVDALGMLVRRFPRHLVAWRDRSCETSLSPVVGWADLLRHDLEIRHAAFLHGSDPGRMSVGAADFVSPFVMPAPHDRSFGTWMLSPLAGIAGADTLCRAWSIPDGLSFAAALLVLGHRALQGGALLWSDPRLVRPGALPAAPGLSDHEAALVVRHTLGRKFLPLWLAARLGDRRFPGVAASRAAARPAPAPFRPAPPPPLPRSDQPIDVDVIIPTMGRRALLQNVLADLGRQTLLPRRVTVVEQVVGHQPDPGPLEIADPPYELVYERLTEPGACQARNAALQRCRSHWVLLADDDMRYRPDYLASLLDVAARLQVDVVVAGMAIVAADGGPDEAGRTVEEPWPRMWPHLGAGAALATRALFDEVGGFDRRLEGGFGEDYEWGVRARRGGAMVVHAPDIRVAHLHAPAGGFRVPYPHPWQEEPVAPVPSPTVVLSRRLWETPAMRRGWVGHYWARRLLHTWPAGPVAMGRQWRAAQRWADVLEHSQEPERATAIGR